MKYWRLFLTGMALSPALSGAAEMRSVQVEFEDDHYVMDAEVWFDADQETVFGVFLDWDLAAEFSSVIVEAKNVGPDEKGGMGYYIHNRGCILFFCKSTRQIGRASCRERV